MDLTPVEVRLVEDYRQKQRWLEGFDAGIEAASRKIISLAEQRGGGTGALNDTDRMLLDAIRKIDPEKGY